MAKAKDWRDGFKEWLNTADKRKGRNPMEIDIDAILETTAACDDDHGLKIDRPSTSSKVREKAVAHLIFRFLQNCPEEATVMELRELVSNSSLSFR